MKKTFFSIILLILSLIAFDTTAKEKSLWRAMEQNDLKTAQKLMETGAFYDQYERRYLIHSAINGNNDFLEFLIKARVNIEAKDRAGNTALHGASFNGHLEIVKLLVKAGANIHATDNYGHTPLYDALNFQPPKVGHIEVVKFLIEKGADVNIETKHNSYTPLHRASESGQVHFVELLIEAGASVHAQDKLGRTALHIASWLGNTEIVKLLIEKGAKVNTTYKKSGTTPLHEASQRGYPDIIELLIEAGAKIHAKDEFDQTAFDLARHREVVNLLIEKGALNEQIPKYKRTCKDTFLRLFVRSIFLSR